MDGFDLDTRSYFTDPILTTSILLLNGTIIFAKLRINDSSCFYYIIMVHFYLSLY